MQLIVTRDNQELFVRPIELQDKEALNDAFQHLSAESRCRRFLAPIKQLTSEELAYFTELDHRDHQALVAVTPSGKIIGVARYIRFGKASSGAEVAVTVVDEWQRHGVGYALLRQLAHRARDAGIEAFTGICLANNRDMIQLLRELGPAVKNQYQQGGVVELEVELPTDADPDTAAAHLRAAGQAARSVTG